MTEKTLTPHQRACKRYQARRLEMSFGTLEDKQRFKELATEANLTPQGLLKELAYKIINNK